MSSITPADPKRCQVEIKQGSAFAFGNPRRTERCKRTPHVIFREKTPGPDGLIGEMSVCPHCINEMPKGMLDTLQPFPPVGPGAFPKDITGLREADVFPILALVAHALCQRGNIRCDDPDGQVIHWEGADDDLDFAKEMGLGNPSKLPDGIGPADMRYVELDRHLPVQVEPWLWNSVCRIWADLWYSYRGIQLHSDHSVHVCFDRETVFVECTNRDSLSKALKLPRSRWKSNTTSVNWEIDIPFSDLKLSDEKIA